MSPAKASFAEDVDGSKRGRQTRAHIADKKRATRQRPASIQSEAVESSVNADAVLEVQQRCVASMVPRVLRAYEAYHHILFALASEAQVARSSAGIQGWAHFADVLDGQTRGGVDGIEESTSGQQPGVNLVYSTP